MTRRVSKGYEGEPTGGFLGKVGGGSPVPAMTVMDMAIHGTIRKVLENMKDAGTIKAYVIQPDKILVQDTDAEVMREIPL